MGTAVVANAIESTTGFDAFIAEQRQTLVGYYAARAWCGIESDIPALHFPALVEEAAEEALLEHLRAAMPCDSMILDLWDWDEHFEEQLGTDWLYEAAFGVEATLASCASILAEHFLAVVDDRDIDYDQHADNDAFQAMVNERAMAFIRDWRASICRRLVVM